MPLVLLVLAILFSSNSFAQEIPENFINARALGMGNAFSSVVDNHNALFYNPAALDRIRGFHLTILDLQVGTDAVNSYSTLKNATTNNYATIIQNYYGQEVWAGISDTLAFSMRDFAVAAYDFFNLSFLLNNPAYSTVTLTATNDYGVQLGFALPIIPEIFRLGIAAKRITRYGGSIPVGPGTVASLSNTYINNLLNNLGTGYGLDAGLLIEVPVGIRPAFSFVWQNIGQTYFIPAAGSNSPIAMDNIPTVGFSSTIDAVLIKIRPAIDYRHINMTSRQLGVLLHLGLEIEFPGFAVRGGANQGYYTAGASLNLKYLTVDAATYGVELGNYPGQMEDRRYIASVVIDLNLDPEINFSGKGENGKRYKSFQRR